MITSAKADTGAGVMDKAFSEVNRLCNVAGKFNKPVMVSQVDTILSVSAIVAVKETLIKLDTHITGKNFIGVVGSIVSVVG